MSLQSLINDIFSAAEVLRILNVTVPGFSVWWDHNDDIHVQHDLTKVELQSHVRFRYGGVSHGIWFQTRYIPAQIYNDRQELQQAIRQLFSPLLDRAAQGEIPEEGHEDLRERYDRAGDEKNIADLCQVAQVPPPVLKSTGEWPPVNFPKDPLAWQSVSSERYSKLSIGDDVFTEHHLPHPSCYCKIIQNADGTLREASVKGAIRELPIVPVDDVGLEEMKARLMHIAWQMTGHGTNEFERLLLEAGYLPVKG